MGPLVALGLAAPGVVYFFAMVLKAYFRIVGLYPLTLFHVWRIPASLVFFWYGAHGALPPLFRVLAGGGDFLSGVIVLPLLRGPVSRETYLSEHLFGFSDFVVAAGTGLSPTLLHDARMAPIGDLPLALSPLFGVGICGASHIIAFHLLWGERRSGKRAPPCPPSHVVSSRSHGRWTGDR